MEVDDVIKIGPWLSEGWNLFAKNAGLLILANLVANIGSNLTCSILQFPLMLGVYYMALRGLRGETVNFDLGFGFQRFGKAMLLWLVSIAAVIGIYFVPTIVMFVDETFGQIVLCGVLLVAVPYLMMLFGLVCCHIADQDADLSQSLSRVFELFKKDYLQFWLCGLVFVLAAAAGAIACGIGALVTAPWVLCATAVAYRDLIGSAKAQPISKPPMPEPPAESTPS